MGYPHGSLRRVLPIGYYIATMIVDLKTRVWESDAQLGEAIQEQMRRRRGHPYVWPDGSTDAHDDAMADIGCAVIHGFESFLLDVVIGPEKVASWSKRNPKKYLGFMGIDPTVGNPVDRLAQGLDLGLVGVTLSPAAAGFHPADSRAMALYQACEARSVPVYFDSNTISARQVKMEFAQPHLLDEVARCFPQLRIAISSLGDPWIMEGLALIGKHPTIYADLSSLVLSPWQLHNALLMAYYQQATTQLVFGSGFPFCRPADAMVTIYSTNTLTQGTHLPNIPRELLRSIIERNTLGCLGLSRPDLDAAHPTPPGARTTPIHT